jgi:hypothetical protein
MERLFVALIVVSMLLLSGGGCDPRVVQCDKCGEAGGVIGGLLPGQGSRCPCGGRVHKVRDLSRADWQEAKKRGYVTLDDGEPVKQGWTPNYDQAGD